MKIMCLKNTKKRRSIEKKFTLQIFVRRKPFRV